MGRVRELGTFDDVVAIASKLACGLSSTSPTCTP
jgi:hypothetical protein